MKSLRFFLVLLSLGISACGGGGGGSDSTNTSNTTTTPCTQSITPHSYLMSFHACDTSATDCGNPQNHTIYLASSDDGISWSLIPEFTPRAGSVPDVAMFQDYLYLFHAGQSENWVKLNACLGVVDAGNAGLSDSSGEDTGGFVDPSLIVNGSELELFYLPGVVGQDPAGCNNYPCTKEIHSATTTGGNISTFTRVTGARAQETLTGGTFSDPDIVTLSNGYLLYVSEGQSTAVYEATDLQTQFSVTGGGSTAVLVSNNSGGVPSGIAVGNEVWLYVTTNQAGKEVIRRGVSSDGKTAIADANFTTVVDASIFGGNASDPINISSPSVISWPASSWKQ